MTKQEYPLKLKPGQRIIVENRQHVVHAVDFFEEDRYGVFHNRVGIETTVGTYLTFPLAQTVEVRG